MGNAFTPGLLVSTCSSIKKIRKIPLNGKALVEVGDMVNADTIVGMAEHAGNLTIIRVSENLEINPQDIKKYLRCHIGDVVREGQVIGEASHFFGFIKNTCVSTVYGYIESINEVTGHVNVREPSNIIEMNAYIPGTVVEISGQDIVIETTAAIVQGIFGLAGEGTGKICVIDNNRDIELEDLKEEHAGAVLIGRNSISIEALQKLKELNVAAIVVGSIANHILDVLLGEPIGVAITGQEAIGYTLIATEGFGKLKMERKTYELFKSLNGQICSFNGTTQIRAGVVRPEVIIKLMQEVEAEKIDSLAVAKELNIGLRIRIIRAPYFGCLARVTALPEQSVSIETEAEVRVLEAACDDGRVVIVPRANVEIID